MKPAKITGCFRACLIILLAAVSVSSLKAEAEKHMEKTFKVGAGGTLFIDADLGSIQVKTHDSKTVQIEVVLESRTGRSRLDDFIKDFNVEFDQQGDDVHVVAEFDRHGNFWDSIGRNVKVRFYATVPQKYNVDLKTSGGSISVDDLEGSVQTKTSGGSLSFGQIRGEVKGYTSGGSIKLTACEGDVDVKTSGGSITLGKVRGNISAHTSGGSIDVEEVMGDIDASTSGGSVTARLAEQPKADCRLTTSGGTVRAYLASDINVNVDAQTSGGRVVTDFPVTIKGDISKRALRARINDGGPELYLRTSGGSIYIKEL